MPGLRQAQRIILYPPMKQLSREMMQRQFKLINYVGLIMISTVFVFAAIVISINNGFIPYKPPPLEPGVYAPIKYILLFISILFYFIIKKINSLILKSIKKFIKGIIIIFALCDAVGVYGLAVFLISGNVLDFYIFMAISMLYFFLFYPRYAIWEKLWEQENSLTD